MFIFKIFTTTSTLKIFKIYRIAAMGGGFAGRSLLPQQGLLLTTPLKL